MDCLCEASAAAYAAQDNPKDAHRLFLGAAPQRYAGSTEPIAEDGGSPTRGTDSSSTGSDAVTAALALAGLFHARPAEQAPASLDAMVQGERLAQLSQLPGELGAWPLTEGRGLFFRSREGRDLSFLERLYCLLSVPCLRLPTCPERTVGEAIRWKSAEGLAAMGLPPTIAAIEIADASLFEHHVYPQYASGAPLTAHAPPDGLPLRTTPIRRAPTHRPPSQARSTRRRASGASSPQPTRRLPRSDSIAPAC